MKEITYQQLAEMITASKGAMPVGIVAETEVKAKKTGNPFASIRKGIKAVGFVGANYEASVNREMGRQGVAGEKQFIADSLPWGEWEVAGKLISHKGKRYLRTQSSPGQRRRQRAKITYWKADGKFTQHAVIERFLPAKSHSDKQEAVGLAAEQIDVRTYAFESLRKVRIKGVTYKIFHP